MNFFLNRLYSDYLMPSRLHEYEKLLVQAKDAGFHQMSVRDFHRSVCQGNLASDRILVHRHDIDSDLRTARKMFALELKHGARASYYFRLSTLDIGFMRDIEAAGSEASYHYEEIASFAKQRRLRCANAIRQRLPEIRTLFQDNYMRIRDRLGAPMATVAAHGDFANRKLKVLNDELLRNPELRQNCGIECEAYDDALMRRVDQYISDKPYPVFYRPVSPFAVLDRVQRLYLLTHPVQWETNWIENTRCNMLRLSEELAWRTWIFC